MATQQEKTPKNRAATKSAPAKNAPKTKQPPLDLATAQVADGSLKPLRSAYEVMGIKDFNYRQSTFASYHSSLASMDLIQLQDHAYEVGVAPAATKDLTIDRLERKYLERNPDQREEYHALKEANAVDEDTLTISQRAQRIMQRGR